MKKTVYWSSIGYKVLSILMVIFFAFITVFIFVNISEAEAPITTICLSMTILLFFVFCCFLSFKQRIILDTEGGVLILSSLKRKVIDLRDLKEIEIDTNNSLDKKRYCFVWFKLLNGTNYKWPGYTCLIKPRKAVEITRQKINDLLQYMSQKE